MESTVGRTGFVSVASLLVAASLALLPGVVRGQEVQSPAPAQRAPAALRTFDIPAQPLSSALVQFGQQAGRHLTVDGNLVRGLASPGVQGTMPAEEALRRLLAGSNLTFSGSAGGTITVHRLDQPGGSGALQLDPVQVQGAFPVPPQAMIDNLPPPYAGGQVATGGQLGLLGNRAVMDTPFNQTSYTARKAQDQQARTVRDVLLDNPSIQASTRDNGSSGDNVRIRGFIANDGNRSYGGLFGVLPLLSVMPELAERIEVLNGPNVMLNGMPPGGIGGTINIVPKRAPDDGLTQVTGYYASAAQFGGHADIARRFGADKQVGVRFNGVFTAGQTSVEGTSDQRGLGVLGLDFRGEHVRLAADLGYQYQYIGGMIPSLGIAVGVPLPWAPDARKNPGPSWNYQERKDLFGVVRAEIDMTERITAYAAFAAHDSRVEGLNVSVLTAANVGGAVLAATPFNGSQYGTYLTGDAGIRGLFDTGPLGHQFALTATTYENINGSAFVAGTPFATNIYNPTIVARPNIPTGAANKVSSQTLSSLGIADTLSAADKRLQLTAGLRLQNVTAQNFDATGRPTTGYDQSVLSPAVALVFKPWQNVSVYGNWIQGLQQGIVVGQAFTNRGEVLPPFQSTQYEAGVKVDWGRLTTTVSAFQITQPSVLTNAANNTQFVGGEQRNQGIELNVFGEPYDGVRLLGGVMFLSPVLAKTQGGLTDGWVAPFSPQFTLNLGAEWDLPFVPGLTLNGRVIYTASQYIDTTWPRRSLPDWTRFDLGVRYAFENPGAKGKLLVARFNVENILDADYWQGGNSATAGLFLGAPQTFRVSLTADF
jgi:iron complex outermembrane receptor protein